MKCVYLKTRPFDDSFIGGVRAHTVGMVNGFVDAGVDICFLTESKLSDIRSKQTVLFDYSDNLSIKKYDRQIADRATTYVREQKNIDFIYNRMDPSMKAILEISLATGVPYIIEYNSSKVTMWKEVRLPQILAGKNLIKKIAARCISPFRCHSINKKEMDLLNHAQIIVTVSDVLKKELLERGIPEKKIIVCPNGVDPSVFVYSDEGRMLVRQELNIPKDEIVVGFSGTFGKWHGIPELTAVIKSLHNEKKLSYLLMGDGLLKKQMENELQDYQDVHFPGKVPFFKMPAYLSACDILLVVNSWNPADKRPFFGSPTKMFEYMSMGKAIVASDLEQIGSILRDGENCFGFDPNSANGMKNAILNAVESPALRTRYGKKAREDVISSFTWKHNAEKIICMLEGNRNGIT